MDGHLPGSPTFAARLNTPAPTREAPHMRSFPFIKKRAKTRSEDGVVPSPQQGRSHGPLFIIGGNEDKKGSKAVLSALLQLVQPADILIIPTASRYPRDVYLSYADAFRDLGFPHVDYLDIRIAGETDRPEHIERVQKAGMVFFSGGDQVKLVSILEGSQVMTHIRNRFFAGDLALGGSSAGTAAMGEVMVFDGDEKGLIKGSVRTAKGFGLYRGLCFDTHFSQRSRHFRLAQFLAGPWATCAIGIDEDTAILFRDTNSFEVIGSHHVTIMRPIQRTSSNFAQAHEGQSLYVSGIELDLLSPGQEYHLKTRTVNR